MRRRPSAGSSATEAAAASFIDTTIPDPRIGGAVGAGGGSDVVTTAIRNTPIG